jgi:hypothetical protein
MSDQLPSTSSSSSSSSSIRVEESRDLGKKFINAATQHGNESNADEENIVVLAMSYSPKREIDEPVEREEFEYNDYVLAKALAEAGVDNDVDMNVSTKTFLHFLSRVL